MPNKLQSSQKYHKAAVDFFTDARVAFCDTPEKRLVGHQNPYRMHNSLFWTATPTIAASERLLIESCLELLGARATSGAAIQEIIWELIEASLGESKQEVASKNFTRQLAEQAYADSTAEWLYIRPNYLIRFSDKIKAISIGPVTAAVASKAIREIKSRKIPSLNAKFRVGKDFKIDHKLGTQLPPEIDFPAIVWMVKTNTTRLLVEQEARWRVDVAASLLRLSLPKKRNYPHLPRTGEVETDPFVKPSFDDEGIKVGTNSLFGGGGGVPHHYIVDSAAARITRTAKFRSLADSVFYATGKTVGERLSRALGWLSRARQARDPAERFLFLFTSIEALLTSQDDDAPITQTIARHAAVMLTNEVKNREQVSKLLSKLYGIRSRLIHRGSRDVHEEDVNKAQVVAEELCFRALYRVDLRMTFADFEATLRSAAYGAKWRPMGG
jgi:hypothetical protein